MGPGRGEEGGGTGVGDREKPGATLVAEEACHACPRVTPRPPAPRALVALVSHCYRSKS